MTTPLQMCQARQRAVAAAGRKSTPCQFGRPNPHNPSIVFSGCPACSRDSAAGVTEQEAFDDMVEFMRRVS